MAEAENLTESPICMYSALDFSPFDILIATYTDGSIESFDISGGTPVPHGDKQYSTATLNSKDATPPF